VKLGLLYSGLLCILAFLVLINFNQFTIFLALASMPLAFTYPLMKRYTYWPQLFLGVTFNFGLILGWTSINIETFLVPFIFYLGAIFWTLGYDTIYGFQDIKDDEIIGLKSTSIKFKSNPYIFLNICYSIFFLTLITLGFLMNLSKIYFIFLILVLFQMFFYQIKKLNLNVSSDCLRAFKSNNLLGLLIFVSILSGKI
jgi:4-hydroxybenzoate polyprenyltransferase